jgi:beta-phosphoglucomutase
VTAAVLWDLDGTLVDSSDYHWRAWRDTLRAEGIELTYRQFLDSFGQKNDRILTGWLGAGISGEAVQRIGDAKEALYRDFVRREGVIALPGALEWIRRLRRAGWLQVIASSAPRRNVEVTLAVLGIEREIDAIVSAEDVTAGKPDPQIFLAAAAKIGIAPDRCVVIEDAVAGIEAARRAGMRSIGVNASAVLDADVYVKSLADLPPDAVEQLLQAPRTSA